jgi:hypothetical protein
MCIGVHEMGRKFGPYRKNLTDKIIKELKKHPNGIWIRELARILKEPVTTVHKYVSKTEHGYPGEFIEIVEKLPRKLGGHKKIKLKDMCRCS